MELIYNADELTRTEENLIRTLRALAAETGGWTVKVYDHDHKEYCGYGKTGVM